MNIKVRKANPDGLIRMETSGAVKEIQINEDFFNPNDESISVCFRGKNSSGIVNFSSREMDMLVKEMKKKMHLIKGIKIFREKK